MDSKEKLKELNVLNAIMLVAILIGIVIGIIIQELIGGVAIGMLGGFITRLIYLRKKYKDINPNKGEINMSQEFFEAVEKFEKKSIKEVESLISNGEEVVLFIGRPTCPYCRRFAPKMNEARQALNKPAIFVNSEDVTQLNEIQSFRQKYGIPTVPGLLVAKGGEARVVCDSSISVEDIIAFVNK